MHAVHLDTFPPVSYLTDTSHAVIRLVHALNKHCGKTLVAICRLIIQRKYPVIVLFIG